MADVCIVWKCDCRMTDSLLQSRFPARFHGRGVVVSRWLAMLLLCLMSVLHSAAASPRIGVMTMQPGEDYWARFGHNAIVVDLQDGTEPLSYNFGYFDFDQPGFLPRFLRGDMRYLAVALPLSQDLSGYASDSRGVSVQWLRLDAAQTDRLVNHLRAHVKPENATYRYDYFTANCSTKVRDALDLALQGHLASQLRSRSQGLTYRFEALRHASDVPWLLWGMDLGLGPMADQPLSLWQQSFIPQRLAEVLQESRTNDGQPLVQQRDVLLPAGANAEASEPPSLVLAGLMLGCLLSVLTWIGLRSGRVAALLTLTTLTSIVGLIGTGLLALWLLTDHVAAWRNANALLFNPVFAIVLGSGAWRAFRRGTHPTQSNLVRLASTLWWVSVLLGWVVLQLGKYPQAQSAWLTMLLPPLVVIAFSARRPSRV